MSLQCKFYTRSIFFIWLFLTEQSILMINNGIIWQCIGILMIFNGRIRHCLGFFPLVFSVFLFFLFTNLFILMILEEHVSSIFYLFFELSVPSIVNSSSLHYYFDLGIAACIFLYLQLLR